MERGFPPTQVPAARAVHGERLADFRNLGVMLRVLLLVNAAALFAATVRAESAADILPRMAVISSWLEAPLIATLLLLNVATLLLLRLPYRAALALALAAAALIAVALGAAQRQFGREVPASDMLWHAAYAIAAGLALAAYFRLRDRAFSPAISEARLQALQARIRPHFLFNSLNAVLSLVRSDPRRAEGALEDLSELFRSLMTENRALTPLAAEIALTRQYLSLEQLRLGARLVVNWKIDPRAEQAMVPPLFLQPLVENAVYHGIEPGAGPGTIDIVAEVRGDALRFVLSNPYEPEHQHRQGNRMALDNIRERLQLHFDVDARMETRATGDRYEIAISMPFRKAR
ncbi:MAG: sensor histidine kinase [Betaproteobacteria bacterium]|nr:sensor histidine kinase [Betaproteobacteria bacterium]